MSQVGRRAQEKKRSREKRSREGGRGGKREKERERERERGVHCCSNHFSLSPFLCERKAALKFLS
jgi:hypothetical protein